MNRQESSAKAGIDRRTREATLQNLDLYLLPAQGKVKGFTLEEGRLWHLLGTRYHYQEDLLGGKELIGITFIIRAGLLAKYFLNEEGRKNHNVYYQAGTLSKTLLGMRYVCLASPGRCCQTNGLVAFQDAVQPELALKCSSAHGSSVLCGES